MTTFQIYRDETAPGKGEWRWRSKKKGRITADSGEGYKRRLTCERALRGLINDCHCGEVKIVEADTAR